MTAPSPFPGTTSYRVTHTTRYDYALPATLCFNEAHLLVRDTPHQRVRRREVVVSPEPDDRSERTDCFGNLATYFSIERPHAELVITASGVVDLSPPVTGPSLYDQWEWARDSLPPTSPDREHLLDSPLVPLEPSTVGPLRELAAGSFRPGRPLGEAVADLVACIHREWKYEPGVTTVSTPLRTVLDERRGVCQDFAHLLIGALRCCGLAARYVSGYLETLPPPGVPKLVGADATHAWASVRLADGNWLDLDPTNNLVAPATHITVAWGRDYSDVAPLKGVVISPAGTTTLTVQVDVVAVPPGASTGG